MSDSETTKNLADGSDAILIAPAGSRALLVLAHGAGAGMRHPFMAEISRRLGESGVATLRYEFPYMRNRKKTPDRPPVLEETVRQACEAGAAALPDVPLFAGGKSMGGRMTSQAASNGLIDPRGIVFLGFPLHRPGDKSDSRADHLVQIKAPMLFVQGTRDSLAEFDRMKRVVASIGDRASLQVVQNGDHSFAVPKSEKRDVFAEVASAIVSWIERVSSF